MQVRHCRTWGGAGTRTWVLRLVTCVADSGRWVGELEAAAGGGGKDGDKKIKQE